MRNRFSFSRGVTLQELLIVIGVIAILCIVAVPTWSKFRKNAQLSGAAELLVADMRTAQQKTVTEQRTYLIRLNLTGQS